MGSYERNVHSTFHRCIRLLFRNPFAIRNSLLFCGNSSLGGLGQVRRKIGRTLAAIVYYLRHSRARRRRESLYFVLLDGWRTLSFREILGGLPFLALRERVGPLFANL